MTGVIKRITDKEVVASVIDGKVTCIDQLTDSEKESIEFMFKNPYVTMQGSFDGRISASLIVTYNVTDDGFLGAVLADLPLKGYFFEEQM